MTFSRPFLHTLRIAVAILFWPVLALVIWGEVLAPEGLSIFAYFNDKVLHFNAYFIMAAMAAAAFRRRRGVIAAVFSLILLGGVLEIVQQFTGRDASVYDELANAVGAILGGILARIAVEPLRRRFGARA
jgi:VanZ family protein